MNTFIRQGTESSPRYIQYWTSTEESNISITYAPIDYIVDANFNIIDTEETYLI